MPSIGAFLRTIRHVRPSSLVQRASILLRQRVEELLPPPQAGNPLPRIPSPPLPPFPARNEQVQWKAEGPVASFLGRELSLAHPVDWEPPIPQLDAMHLHYMEYLEGLDSETAIPLVLDWIRANPRGRRNAWRTGWNSYALSLRVVVWMQAWARSSWQASPEEELEIRRSLCDQIRYLTSHLEMDIRGNHLIKNLKALLWASRFFEGTEAEGWGELGSSMLAGELETQILRDGMHFELSPSYHLQVFADLLECHQVLPNGLLRARLAEILQSMGAAAAHLTHPDGLPSLFGDGGLHMTYPPSTCHQALTSILGGKALKASPVFALKAAGYYGLQAPGESLIVDCGPIAPDALPAHGHGDALSFEWSLGGQRVIIDTGVHEYREGPRRAQARGTQAHNTVTLDGLDQAEFWKSFRLGRRPFPKVHDWHETTHGFQMKGSHDGYAHLPGMPIHIRTYEARPHALQVEDQIQGGRGQRVEARLHLHPDLQVELMEGGARIRGAGLQVVLRTSASVALEPAAWWPDLGVELPTHCLVLTYGSAPCIGGFALEAYTDSLPSPDAPPPTH